LKTLTGISLILVIVLVSLSSYLRLTHSGIGCAEWPQCYGRIGPAPVSGQTVVNRLQAESQDAYQRLLEQSSGPLAWATPLHRLIASLLGLLVVFLNVLAVRQKRQRLLCLAVLALTVGLAVLGIRSGSLHDPAVVMGNLAGGFILLGLLGCLRFNLGSTAGRNRPFGLLRGMALVATMLLAGQILLGGFTSANFAATSCSSLPDCQGGWWPGTGLFTAMDLSRKHQVNSSGQAIGGPERIAIHRAHRLGAVNAAAAILIAAILAIRSGGARRTFGVIALLLLVAEFTVGVASVLFGLPIALAVAHNWLAALLLLALLKLLFPGPQNAGKAPCRAGP
jgi:cytochrome c oxidase assembly protein subunit 15